MLDKIRNIGIAAAIALVGGAAAYAWSGIDWEAAFGPGIAGIIFAGIGYFTKEGLPKIQAYLEAQKVPED